MRWMVCRAAPWWTDACEDGGGGVMRWFNVDGFGGGRGAVLLHANLLWPCFLFSSEHDKTLGWVGPWSWVSGQIGNDNGHWENGMTAWVQFWAWGLGLGLGM